MQVEARVVQTLGKHHLVWAEGREFPAFPAGRLGLESGGMKNRVAVGDRVLVRTAADGTGLVEEVLPRRNRISRRMSFSGDEHVVAANVDALAIVLAARPEPSLRLLDRYLVEAFASDVTPLILVNKMDLSDEDAVRSALEPYEALGYRVFLLSAKRGDGLGDFLEAAAGRWAVLVGHSGVGKTTLVNALVPETSRRAVGEVDARTGKGKHTTSSAVAHRLAGDTVLVDTAGIREFGLFGVDFRCLEGAFPEIHEAGARCRYADCRHGTEPGCAVREAAANGLLLSGRYESYLHLLGEAEG